MPSTRCALFETGTCAATKTHMPHSPTLYQLLGVPEHATPQQVRNRYRQLVFQYHPDRNGGASYFEEKLKSINAAYDILSDRDKRRRYDELLAAARAPVRPRPNTAAPATATQTVVTDPDADPPWVKPFFRVFAFVLVTAFLRECRYSDTSKYSNPVPVQQVADTAGGSSWYLPGYDRVDTALRSMRIDTNLLNKEMPPIKPLDISLPIEHEAIPLQKAMPVRMDSSGELKF
ncbi:hypothetical protein BUE76_01335 [Cnuella takakiae]|nr:hypothetical protein BUE76_01335 [Cnuella takakiae]